jgi:hypothetical protein
MALVPSTKYPAQTDVEPAYPQGKARNAGTFQDGSGTPLEKDWVNDQWGFLQSLLAAASITPSGTPDQVGASQYLAAVQNLAQVAAAAATGVAFKAQALKGWSRVSTAITGNSLGAARDPSRALALISNGSASGTLRVRGDGSPTAAGNIAANVKDIARDPGTDTYVAAVGSPNFAYRSTNFGTSWAIAATKPADAALRVVWGDGVFLAIRGDNNIYTSPTGDIWTLRTTAGGILVRSCCPTKDSLGAEFLLAASQIAVEVTSNSGVSWAAAGALPDAAHHGTSTATSMTSIPVGNQVLPFFLANYDGGVEYRVYTATATGAGWTQISSLPLPAPLIGDNCQPRIIGDNDTGALVAVLQSNAVTKGSWLFLSTDRGLTWSSGVCVDASNSAVAMANGRIFISNAIGISMSAYEGELL